MMTQQHIEEGLSRAYVAAVAARAGVNLNWRGFDYGVDGAFCRISERDGRHAEDGITLDYQLKASTRWRIENQEVVYQLEAKTYNDLASRRSGVRVVPLILILFCLPKEESQWLEINEENLLMRKCCYWTLVDERLTKNAATVTIGIPREQLLTSAALLDLLGKVERGEL